jgi:sugar phosphate isomerase/epimerase
MKVGILQAAAFPGTGPGEGPNLAAIEQVAADDFFEAIEVTTTGSAEKRRAAGSLLRASKLVVDFDVAGALIREQVWLASLDPDNRSRAIDLVKAGVDEACELGAERVNLVSGPDPGDRDRPAAKRALVDSLNEVYTYARNVGELELTIKVADRAVDKKFLIGPTADAVETARTVREANPGFGLIVNLSHLPLLFETAEASLTLAAGYLVRAHLGNCMMKDRTSPIYGDTHPRFGYPGSENDVPELAEFLRQLVAIGYVGLGRRNIVSYEVRPHDGENPRVVIANSKRTLLEAWALA